MFADTVFRTDVLSKSGETLDVINRTYGTNDVTQEVIFTSPKTFNPKVNGWRNPAAYLRYSSQWSDWKGVWQTMFLDDPHYTFIDTWSPYPQPNTLPVFNRNGIEIPSWLINAVEIDAKISLKQQKVNYTVELAQAGEAFRMISKNLQTLFFAYKYAKQGQWGHAAHELGVGHAFQRKGLLKQSAKDLSNRWLELQYGWLPLLHDIRDGYEDVRDGFVRKSQGIFVRKVKTIPVREEFEEVLYSSIPPVRGTYKSTGTQGCRVRLDYTLDNENLANAAKVGLTNPAELAWELIPFSFVLDWIVPVGDFISSLDADQGLTFRGGSKTVFIKFSRKGRAQVRGVPFDGNRRLFKNIDIAGSFDAQFMQRTVYSSTPYPMPYLKNPVSASHFANALALGVQVLTGAKSPRFD